MDVREADRPRGLSDLLDDEAVAYRPVSALAVVGAALAAVSLLALVTPWLAPAPLVAAVASWAAARRIERDPSAQSGRGIALAGLSLSLLTLGALAVKGPVSARLHGDAAARVTDRFVQLLAEGDRVRAFELTLPFPERHATPEAATAAYASGEEKSRLEEFSSRPELARVDAAAKTKTPSRSGRVEVATVTPGRVVAVVPYRLAGSGDTLQVRAERTGSSRWGGVTWRVTEFGVSPATP